MQNVLSGIFLILVNIILTLQISRATRTLQIGLVVHLAPHMFNPHFTPFMFLDLPATTHALPPTQVLIPCLSPEVLLGIKDSPFCVSFVHLHINAKWYSDHTRREPCKHTKRKTGLVVYKESGLGLY